MKRKMNSMKHQQKTDNGQKQQREKTFENENIEKEANEQEKRSKHDIIAIGTMIIDENTFVIKSDHMLKVT